MTVEIAQKPAHVPTELVFDFDYTAPAGHETDVHLAWNSLHDEGVPDILWTPRHGGHWLATRAEDIDVMQLDHERFSHSSITVPQGSTGARLLPLEYDPPEHTAFRALISPRFGPRQVQALEADARRITNQLIDGFLNRGECEFVTEFARHLPVYMFLKLVDLPLEDREELLNIAESSVRPKSPEERMEAGMRLNAYVESWVVKRRAEPGPDLFSLMVNAKVDGRDLEPHETTGLLHNVLFGGLDTVASSLGFFARFLADNPGHRKQLIEQPKLIMPAIDELLRRFGIPQTARVITRDFVYKGVQFKEGEQIMMPKVLHGLDERKYQDPLTVDFTRRAQDHAAFGAGPHRCAGAALARMEIRVFLEEWLRRIPDFSIKPGEQPATSSGAVNGMMYLPLVW